jgi:hypothetical protein
MVLSLDEMSFFERLFRSLESEMDSRFNDMNSRFDRLEVRMDRMETRMDRIGGLVNGGTLALTRLIEWSERTDQIGVETLRRINDLNDRVTKIEPERERPGQQG